MTNQNSAERAEKQYRLKVASLLGSVTHAQVLADQALEQAGGEFTPPDPEPDGRPRTGRIGRHPCVGEFLLRVR